MTNTIAADLRNAALLIEHGGHEIGSYISLRKGSMCLDGALKLATIDRLVTSHLRPGDFNSAPIIKGDRGEQDDALIGRYIAALAALTDAMPELCTSHLPGGCPQAHSLKADEDGKEHNVLHASTRVHHYNDWECDGAEEAARLLRSVADIQEIEELTNQLQTQEVS